MYDELIKRLRELPHLLFVQLHGHEDIVYKAADAIEELSMKLHGDEAAIVGMKREIERMVVADKPRWIPVTERLPNENDNVLIYGEWTGASGTKYREIWLTDLKGFLHQGYKPIAWMPLQEPPKEEP